MTIFEVELQWECEVNLLWEFYIRRSVDHVTKTWFIILMDEMIIRKYSNMNRWSFLDITINNVLQVLDIHIPTTFLLPGWTQTVTCIVYLLCLWLILFHYRKIRDSRNIWTFLPLKAHINIIYMCVPFLN